MSRSIKWLPALMMLLLLPSLVAAASSSGSRTMDYAWLLFLKKVNEPPQVDAGTDQGTSTDNVDLNATVSDDPRDTLTYTWSKVSGPGSVVFSNASTEDTSVSFSVSGTYVLQLSASDGELTAVDQVIVTVTNTAPQVDAGSDKLITYPVNDVYLNASASDAENNIQAYAWTKVDGPGSVSFGSPSAEDTTAVFSVTGTYTLRLTVSDWEFTSTDTVTVKYLPQSVPLIDAVVTIGDSITVGFGDVPSCQPNLPGTPDDDIDKACDGYTVPLAGILSGAEGYASTVYIRERGTSGKTSGYLLYDSRLQSIISDHPAADQYLIMYGTNDANMSPPMTKAKFKDNIQRILLTIKGTKNIDGVYMEPVLAKAAYAKDPYTGLNYMIRQYNEAVVELTNTYRLKGPANMYDYFEANQNQLNTYNVITGALDGLHPTHEGYYWMSRIWASHLR